MTGPSTGTPTDRRGDRGGAPLTLVVTEGDAAGAELVLGDVLVIGRGEPGPGRLGGDPRLSRRHARLTRDAAGLFIEDLGSTNGTCVNDLQVAGRTALADGDRIRVGRTTLQVRSPAGAPGAPQPEPGATAPMPAAPRAPLPDRGGASAPRTGGPAPAFVLHDGHRTSVPPAGATIGRQPDSDVVVAADVVSRRHARIAPGGSGWTLTDLGTVNGTYLNGERLHDEARPLASGDTIEVGPQSLRFLTGAETRFGAVPGRPQSAQPVRMTGDRLGIGRDPANDVQLDDPNVSRVHAEVVRTASGFELRDLGSRNGTRLDGRPVGRAALSTGSEIGIGPFRLLFDGTSFLQRDERGALRLDAEDLTITVKGKTILKRAAISIQPGEFVVIIGESGSGKSTLIKALAGVTHPSEGRVSVNGEPVSARLTDIGYVPQDEIVHGHLTVLEALRYSARLRLPRDSTAADIDAAVRRVLREVSLEEHANTRIGSLSGGQRKRAGVASELLSRPSLLFLDEPTTGLDPGLETRMMELFRELAEPGARALAVVTHATKNLARADKICVMGRGGDLAYFGPPEEAKAFFGADSFDGIYQALEDRPAVEWRRRFEAEQAEAAADDTAVAAPSRVAAPAAARGGRRPVLVQAGILAHRYARLMMRDRRNLAILLGQVPVIALGIALLFKANVLSRADGRPSDAAQLLFLLATTAIWLGSIDGSREIIKERSVAVREAAVGVRPVAYLLSKVGVLFVLAAVQTVLLAGLVLALRPLHEPRGTYLLVLGLLVLTCFVAVGMGLLISSAVNSEDQATSFIPLALIPQLLFAGAIVPLARMGEGIPTLADAVFARWSFAAIGTAIDMNDRLGADRALAKATGYGAGFFDVSAAAGFLALAAFLLVFLVATGVRLRRRA